MSFEDVIAANTEQLRRLVGAVERLALAIGHYEAAVYAEDPDVVLAAQEPKPTATTPVPPAQTVAPEGTDMTWFSKPGAAPPPAAVEARKLADHPGFQAWAVYRLGVDPSKVADSVAFSLRFICSTVNAASPADFAQEAVVSRFVMLKKQFEDSPYAQ